MKSFLVLDPNYDDSFLPKNKAMTIFILSREKQEVIKTSVVERGALPGWYAETAKAYPSSLYTIIACNISVAGVIVGFATEEDFKKANLPFGTTRIQ